MINNIINKLKSIDKKNINSFLIAILCMSGLISFVVDLNNTIIFILLTTLLLLECINAKDTFKRIKDKKIKVNNLFSIFFIVVISFFVISLINNGASKELFLRLGYFFFFLIIPYSCFRHNVNLNSIIYSILGISVVLTIPLSNMNLNNYDGGTRMVISYYMLPTYISFIMSFFINKEKSIKYNIIKFSLLILALFPYINFLFESASRGILLAILVCIWFCVIVTKSKKIRKIIFLSTFILAVIGLIFFKPIIIGTDNLLHKLNMDIDAISKSADLLKEDSFDNGRNKVYTNAINGIKEHPIIGNGIGEYAKKYITYPHNLLLQAWYECGVLFFTVMLSIVIFSFYVLIFDDKVNLKQKYLLILFISISLVRLMLSYEFWREIGFGLYLYIIFDILQNKFNIKKEKMLNGKRDNSNI